MLLFLDAILVDGSGAPPARGSLLANHGRIERIAPEIEAPDCEVIDCKGLVLAPGFLDVHSHSDLQILRGDRAKADQGVTTEVVGNCGFSAFPCGERDAEVREFADPILYGSGAKWHWDGAKDYLKEARKPERLCHVESLVGHGTLRTAVAGPRQGSLEPAETGRMEGLLGENLEAGACGLSTGLMYAPGSSAPREELERLCRVVAKAGKIYATHMRSYGDGLLAAIDEQLDLARATGCRLQISHLQAAGSRNWPKQKLALEKLEQANREGIDVAFDSYPYLAGSTVLQQLLPQWALDGGVSQLLARLADPEIRARLREEIARSMPQRWSDIFIAGVASSERRAIIGRDVASLAAETDQHPAEYVFDLLTLERSQVTMVSFNQSDENLRELMGHPLCSVISDGVYVSGRPHPRLYGTFPSLLGDISRDRGWLSLSEAVRRITSRPAERFGLAGRGRLAPGMIADLVLFDPATIAGPATYDTPTTAPIGIRGIWRSGKQCK